MSLFCELQHRYLLEIGWEYECNLQHQQTHLFHEIYALFKKCDRDPVEIL